MNIKKEEIVDKFLENNNMDYLFCILSEKEADRLSSLPESIKKGFDEKITTMSLKHIALNNIPDFIVDELEESEEKPIKDFDYEEEYQEEYSDRITDNLDNYDNYDKFGDDADFDEEDDDYDDDDV